MAAKNNTKLELMDKAVCRTSAFAQDAGLTDCWSQLKEMIKDASPAFYEVIEKLGFEELGNNQEKTAYSVWKYFNRSRLRATPFGRFAALSVVSARPHGPLVLENRMMARHFPDWSEKDALMGDMKRLLKESAWFRSNATYYTVGNEVRYIRHAGGQFELTAVESSPELNFILNSCQQKSGKVELYALLNTGFNLEPATITHLLLQLISCQLLFTERFPNISGEDYFERLKITGKPNQPSYIIAERKLRGGGLDTEALAHVPGYLNFMSAFLPANDAGHLDAFKKSFIKKFDRKAVPLALALDPETGVGYGDMAQDPQESELLHLLENFGKPTGSHTRIPYTAPIQFLLNEMLKGGAIQLDACPTDVISAKYPNTLSVLLRYWNGAPVIESAGGCTANALLGRFATAIEEVYTLAKEIAGVEEKANPAVLFFDVAYQAEKNVDNVNRRQLLYGAEFPVLGWSCHTETLSIGDMLVAVRNGEVVLWSKKHAKRLVPRIASAYNYSRSDLAVYRFMCELQYQGLTSNINLRVRQLLPGLDHYPRIMYRNLVVSPAMWRLGARLIFPPNEKSSDSIVKLVKWLEEKGIVFSFRCGTSDQTLCFDPGNQEDLGAFIQYRRQNPGEGLYIEEALMGGKGGAADEHGNHLTTQYVLNYYHREQVYEALQVPVSSGPGDAFFPGGIWLYAEIYCHPSRSDQVLTKHLRGFLSAHQQAMQKWFFIRYADGGPHIRLRIQVKDVMNSDGLTGALRLELEPLCRAGLISDIQVKTYFPETERYGPQRMARVEQLFHLDSVYVLRVLSKGGGTDHLYRSTVALMDRLCSLAFDQESGRLGFARGMAESFGQEFLLGKGDFKRINTAFEKIKKDIKRVQLPRSYQQTFCPLMKETNDTGQKTSLLADLIHMHVNRVFHSGQRGHEAILYQYLLKLMLTRGFISKAERVPVSIL